jgi:hypothetical protein
MMAWVNDSASSVTSSAGSELMIASRFRWIAARGFVHDKLGNRTLELAPSIGPPFLCRLLMRRDQQVSARLSHEITDERCFKVNGFHDIANCKASL